MIKTGVLWFSLSMLKNNTKLSGEIETDDFGSTWLFYSILCSGILERS